ncbi:MAG: hypothetical protein WCK18_05335 [Prolixibacteraceae bacterium]
MKKVMDLVTSGFSRRNFLKTTALATIGSITVGSGLAAVLSKKGRIVILIDSEDALASAIPPLWAAGELKIAMEKQGSAVRIVKRLADVKTDEFCIIAGGMKSSAALSIIRKQSASAPSEPESLCIVQGEIENRSVLLAAGTDIRGLVYALTELADRVSCLASTPAGLEFGTPVIERPSSRIRSILRGFCSEVEDKSWFYDKDYWRNYLSMLVSTRVNRFNLSLGMGYNSAQGITDGYFIFPYPFLVKVPGYEVHAKDLPEEERVRNFETLKFIGEECARRGLYFQLGVWTLAYTWNASPNATYRIEGLTDATHGSYCCEALAIILREVPAITGVTFRVHSESGIPKGSGNFWKTQFSAIEKCGRPVEIDMHLKLMEAETLAFALATGQRTVVSPKFCGEHMGLPYHQASIRTKEMSPEGSFSDEGIGLLAGDRRFTRSGYGDSLSENRNWDVVFRIWPGTQRFLLGGDPATYAGYGRTASFCGAAGFEWSEPLHFKGRHGTGLSGGRCAYADNSLAPHYDFEKYLYTYRLWGRLGYNPETDPEVWLRYVRRDFGKAAVPVMDALASVSRVLPLFTLVHGQSTDCGAYWPEIYTNMSIASEELNKMHKDTTPPVLFGNVCPFDPQLFYTPFEYGEALVTGKTNGKYTPLEVAQWFEEIAAVAKKNISKARSELKDSASNPEFRRVEEDVLILCGLALFFAGKLRSAVLWQIYTLTGERKAGEEAIACFTKGRNAWATMAERAKNVYVANISYGTRHGHWLDRIPSFDEDISDLQNRIGKIALPSGGVNEAGAVSALRIALGKTVRTIVNWQHTSQEGYINGKPLPINLNCRTKPPEKVVLYYRHVDQAERWQSVGLTRKDTTFQGEIPAEYTTRRFPLQYYFEVTFGKGDVTLFPPLAGDLSNVPYFVVRKLKS